MKRMLLSSLFLTLLLFISSEAMAGPYTNDAVEAYVNGQINPIFTGWADYVVDYSPSDETGTYGQNGIGSQFADPDKALGERDGSIVSLGDMHEDEIADWQADPINNGGPGEITLGFNRAITNKTGFDFAVFENGFISGGKLFAELGYVEVSSDGVNFARFDSISLTNSAVGGYGTVDPTDLSNLAGKHPNNYGTSQGTGFDLSDLMGNTLVTSGLVDLNAILYVKIVDIPGSGDFLDSMGNGIYDAWVTWGSGGVDLDAVGAINTVPVPGALMMLISGLLGLSAIKRR